MCSIRLSKARSQICQWILPRCLTNGFANLHALTLDLGPVDAQSPLRLLMTGYVNYFSATSLYAAWQAGVKPISLTLKQSCPMASGSELRTMWVSRRGWSAQSWWILTGKLPAGTRRIRLK